MMLGALPINGETWIICGGRDYGDAEMFTEAMTEIATTLGLPSRIVHGGATGADALAAQWAERMALDVKAYPADWKSHGRSAGPIRNQAMLQERPDRVIAFPGGRGTADMVQKAQKQGAAVILVDPKPAEKP